MKILNFGSLNLDLVYRVDAFVKPGETKSAKNYEIHVGGKGLNQSVALARAGANVYHACMLGEDGKILKETLKDSGVNIDYIKNCNEKSGHAVIQVEDSGQNSILLYGGSNKCITREFVNEVLQNFKCETLLLQNEINQMPYIIKRAKELDLKIFFNAAPMNSDVLKYPLEKIDFLIVNEVEGKEIAKCDEEKEIIPRIIEKYPKMSILLTLGKRGAICSHNGKLISSSACNVKSVDTTGAGDTFTGYFIESFLRGESIEKSLEIATVASAITIGKMGASNSIPDMIAVQKAIKDKIYGDLIIKEK